jgi:hypothetical protein
MKTILLLMILASPVSALTLLEEGRSDHQIVVPENAESPAVAAALAQTARLLQTAFQANGATVGIVPESGHDASKPALWLGDTKFARAQGIDVTRLRDWSYVLRVVGRDVVIAGHDHPARVRSDNPRRPNWDRVGTAKAAADFAREFLGVRFLYPELPGYTPVSGAAKIDLAATPALEFLPMARIEVPDTLDVAKTPVVRLNTAHPAGGSFYDIAHNRFPRVDEQFGSHTWERAVPAELFAEHPEYFALVNGERLRPDGGNAQYCLSHPEVQERIYRDLASHLDRGYASVDLGQPDGFRECQCADCEALYGTGKDWSEKIWIFHRKTAERLQESHPGGQVTMMSYILTAAPPKSFTRFPENTGVMLTGTNEEDIAPWRGTEVPRGFTGYLYNWCPNLGTRYTPMRTPGHIERQVKRLAENQVRALQRDGPGQLFGLEGPVYYIMGRMLDDPARLHANDLFGEFCEAAFPDRSIAFTMRGFYEELYHAIALYSDHLGTRTDAWTYRPFPTDPRPRKTVTDPFQLLAFLYPPPVLANLEAHLAQAEGLARAPKVRARLALVRTEFDYVRHLARVVHLHQAWQVAPDGASWNRLLDAIEARNEFIAALYRPGHQTEWNHVLFPFPGHDAKHLRLAHDGYQEPYANTCLNWDTTAMRQAPPPEKRRLRVGSTTGDLALDSPAWEQAAAHPLTLVPPLSAMPRRASVRLLRDAHALHLRMEAELGEESRFPALARDAGLTNQEAFDICLVPDPARPLRYRLTQGVDPATRYDAVSGRIADAMDPRHGRDDPTWNGAWTSTTRVDGPGKRWHAHVVIPFAALEVDPPAAGMVWKANFGRNHALPRGRTDRAIWSVATSMASGRLEDAASLGEIVFE